MIGLWWALVGCTPDTPYLVVDEPTDLAYGTGVYRIEDLSWCGDPAYADPTGFFSSGILVSNLLDGDVTLETRFAEETTDGGCVPFEETAVLAGEEVLVTPVLGGTLIVYDEAGEPLHGWFTMASGSLVIQ